ncbi:hypothetical protein ABIE52_006955 [Rhodococcus sp. OAS809]|uniref:DEAD/DEAH box helicase n=1 Tax=Rhodococcus sp. OAS809 TaxID=2663874 RepID=UPI00178B40D2
MTSPDPVSRPRPRFKRKQEAATNSVDPESLFGDLPRTPHGVGALWSHQADQLRTYSTKHRETPDVALELPTGSGKTLVGLLIAEWRRRALGQRVLYACPTTQLARQVQLKAQQQGIQPALLVGTHRKWAAADLTRYTNGSAIAITTYSSIFNSRPHLGDAQTVLFDDAHAAESYVAEAWSVLIKRGDAEYTLLLDAFQGAVDAGFLARMASEDAAADGAEVRLLPIEAVAKNISDIEAVLATIGDNRKFAFGMLRARLSSCLFYVARSGVYIRPMIPPTFAHDAFTDPTQRVYLSASLGDAGELERAFGRTPIERVPVPPAWDRTGSGRRFFVFPELALAPVDPTMLNASLSAPSAPIPVSPDATKPVDAEDPYTSGSQDRVSNVTAALLNLSKKRLVLTPDDQSAVDIANAMQVPHAERFDAKTDAGLEPFLQAETGTLLAPNRYDGMDLAAESCRLMLMAGLPTASHLQDRFLESKLRAGEVLHERIRTRVLQGVGRCTRGPSDWAVVVVQGDDLLRFLSRREVRESLPVELQAEIKFGLEVSETAADDLVLLAESALKQDEIWQADAEPDLVQLRKDAVRKPATNVAVLTSSAPREVRAWSHAWKQDWEGAARAAIDVLNNLPPTSLRPYRALWAYLGSAWSTLAAEENGNSAAVARATQLLRDAHKEAEGTTWLKEVQPLPSAPIDEDPLDAQSIGNIVSRVTKGGLASPGKFANRSSTMLSNLSKKSAPPYEQALAELGLLIGASESFKPQGKGRADTVWIWDSAWITVEAKSESEDHGLLSMDYVRQANTQLDSVAGDRAHDEPPSGSVSFIVSTRRVVDPDAVDIARPHLYLVPTQLIAEIAHDVVRAWNELRGVAFGVDPEALHDSAARIFWEHRVLPTQIRERLTREPIRGAV